jgi:hypothetical protein
LQTNPDFDLLPSPQGRRGDPLNLDPIAAFAPVVPASTIPVGRTARAPKPVALRPFASPASACCDGEGIAQEQGAFGRHQFARLQTVQDLIVAVP